MIGLKMGYKCLIILWGKFIDREKEMFMKWKYYYFVKLDKLFKVGKRWSGIGICIVLYIYFYIGMIMNYIIN